MSEAKWSLSTTSRCSEEGLMSSRRVLKTPFHSTCGWMYFPEGGAVRASLLHGSPEPVTSRRADTGADVRISARAGS